MSSSIFFPSSLELTCDYPELLDAIRRDDLDKFMKEFQKYDDVNLIFHFADDGCSPWVLVDNPPIISVILVFCALKCFNYVISMEPDLKIVDDQQRTVMIFSVVGGNLEMVRTIESHGGNLNDEDINKNSLCHYAAKFHSFDVLKWLFSVGAPINVRNINNAIPLMWACSNHAFDIVKFLVDNGSDINTMTNGRWTPLHYAVGKEWNTDIVNYLLSFKNIELDILNKDNNTPIMVSAKEGTDEILRLLIQAGASFTEGISVDYVGPSNLGLQNQQQEPPDFSNPHFKRKIVNFERHHCNIAIKNGHFNCVKVFFEEEKSRNAFTNETFLKTLKCAFTKSEKQIVEYIAARTKEHPFVDFIAQNDIMNLAKLIIIKKSNSNYLDYLKDFDDFDINWIDPETGYNLLHTAISNQSKSFIKKLVSLGINVNQTTNEGIPTILFSLLNGNLSIVKEVLNIENIDLMTDKKEDFIEEAQKHKVNQNIIELYQNHS